jgi:hypothetical protein
MFEYSFRHQNLTWFKDIECTLSHWWYQPWTPEQEDYALKDVETVKMAVNKTFDNVGNILEQMAKPYPVRFEVKKTNKTGNQLANPDSVGSTHLPPSKKKS